MHYLSAGGAAKRVFAQAGIGRRAVADEAGGGDLSRAAEHAVAVEIEAHADAYAALGAVGARRLRREGGQAARAGLPGLALRTGRAGRSRIT